MLRFTCVSCSCSCLSLCLSVCLFVICVFCLSVPQFDNVFLGALPLIIKDNAVSADLLWLALFSAACSCGRNRAGRGNCAKSIVITVSFNCASKQVTSTLHSTPLHFTPHAITRLCLPRPSSVVWEKQRLNNSVFT